MLAAEIASYRNILGMLILGNDGDTVRSIQKPRNTLAGILAQKFSAQKGKPDRIDRSLFPYREEALVVCTATPVAEVLQGAVALPNVANCLGVLASSVSENGSPLITAGHRKPSTAYTVQTVADIIEPHRGNKHLTVSVLGGEAPLEELQASNIDPKAFQAKNLRNVLSDLAGVAIGKLNVNFATVLTSPLKDRANMIRVHHGFVDTNHPLRHYLLKEDTIVPTSYRMLTILGNLAH